MPILQLVDLAKQFPSGLGVHDINLNVETGKFIVILGPSGCGKTTVLRLIAGFIKPTSGNILIDGRDIIYLPPEKRPTAMVFQNYSLWPHMTVYENMAFGLRLRKIGTKEIERQITDALKMVRLYDVINRYPSQLSGGEQQRVALVRALLLQPRVLLLDEPFSSLDAQLRIQLREEIKGIQRNTRTTMLFVTHDQEEAMYLGDTLVLMNHGTIEQTATPMEVYDSPQSLFVARFLGEMNCFEFDKNNNPLQYVLQGQDVRLPLVIGVRPEDVRLSSRPGPIYGEIQTSVSFGHYIRVAINTNIGAIFAYFPRGGEEGDASVVDDKVTYVEFSKIHLFHESL